jgi:HmuY protein
VQNLASLLGASLGVCMMHIACSDAGSPFSPSPNPTTITTATATVPTASTSAPPLDDASVPDVAVLTDADASVADARMGEEVLVDVEPGKRSYVNLAMLQSVSESEKSTTKWDLAFQGYDIFTNGGVSGSGKAKAFGPYPALAIVSPDPNPPFLLEDRVGGTFLDWYKYEGAPAHVLLSRFHTYAVRDGARTWKVQVLGYYDEVNGNPVSASYTIRYAELTPGQEAPVREITRIDGASMSAMVTDATPSECLDLGTGERTMQTPAQARTASNWHLCFRRAAITVNGEQGGPRGVVAANLDVAKTPNETVDEVRRRTSENTKSAFDSVQLAAFANATFRGDRIVTAFSDLWFDKQGGTFTPRNAAWYVVGATSARYFVVFTRFEGATAAGPGRVALTRIKL